MKNVHSSASGIEEDKISRILSFDNQRQRKSVVLEAKHLEPQKFDDLSWGEAKDRYLPLAKSGDANAAEEFFRLSMECREYFRIKKNIDNILAMYQDGNVPADMLNGYDEKLKVIKEKVQHAKHICMNASEADVNNSLNEAVRLAAEQGSVEAQTCYLDGAIFGAYSAQSDEVKSTYSAEALEIASAALRSGSWEMVDILTRAFQTTDSDAASRGWLGEVVTPSPTVEYALTALANKCRVVAGLPNLNSALANQISANKLATEDVSEADAWADGIYTKYYANVPYPSANVMKFCPTIDTP
ncbi:MAG: hypothetical protein QM741_07985 [Rudaea sp.]|uniref:hypothetical protein n=1 Tax=Rudaea sp. TaxID=2136325 RepID=UPI0039E28725